MYVDSTGWEAIMNPHVLKTELINDAVHRSTKLTSGVC